MEIDAPFPKTSYSVREVTARYCRNGYEWDIHGSLYLPTKSILPDLTILMVHGGGVNELIFDKAPDGHLGWARVLASQGFKVLSVTYPGQWPPGGAWSKSAKERTPIFLFDREIELKELQDRILKYTFNLVVEGIAILADKSVPGNRLLVFGHSLGGRLVVDVWRFAKKTKVVGVLGFASLGPQIWIEELQERLRQRRGVAKPISEKPTIEQLTRFRRSMSGIREPRIFLPVIRSIPELEECARITRLPQEEYFDNTLTKLPDPAWLRSIKVLLLVGENDNFRHWPKDRPIEDRPEYFYAQKFAQATRGTHLISIPKYNHTGYLMLHSEKMVYLWLWAIKSGYFN